MKKKFLALAFVAVMVLGFSMTADGGSGEPCQTIVIQCGGGNDHTVIVCDMAQMEMWKMLLCGGGQ